MRNTQRPRQVARIEVPKFGLVAGPTSETVIIEPPILGYKLEKNSHHLADKLSLTLGPDAGVDPRQLNAARVVFWAWDDAREDYDESKPRFAGVLTPPVRRNVHEGTTTLEFLDYTDLFLACKPFPPEGVPLYSDNLTQAWRKICDHTGWYDIETKQILSTVEALRDRLVFRVSDPAIQTRPIGAGLPDRYHAVSKPPVPHGASAWEVWRWIAMAMGLYTYIDGDRVIVSDAESYYDERNPVILRYGENLHELELEADPRTATKAVLCRSTNPATGLTIESVYPPPGDPRVKTRRATAPKNRDEFTEASNAATVYNTPWVTRVDALDRLARAVWENKSREELTVRASTSDLWLYDYNTNDDTGEDPRPVSVFELGAGDAFRLQIEADPYYAGISDEEYVERLVELGYRRDIAFLLLQNSGARELLAPIFHVKSVEIEVAEEDLSVRITGHNLIRNA